MRAFTQFMIAYSIAAILALLVLIMLTAPAAAQSLQHCAPRDVVVARLTDIYGETRHAIGLAANNSVVEVFASGKTGTWTITVTMASGVTCLVASGQAFEALAEALQPEGDPL